MEYSFFLTTKRTGFSIWKETDLKRAEALWGNPDVSRFICATGKFTAEDISSRLKTEISNEMKYHVQYWPVFELSSFDFIGCCGLRHHDDNKYELGFHLLPRFWGRGYATETAMAVIDYAFNRLNAKVLFAGHHPENAASAKVLQKLGFIYIGDEFYKPTGLFHPSYEMKRVTTEMASDEDLS